MENISETLKRLGNNKKFKARYEKMKQEILSHPSVRSFLAENQDLVTTEMVERNLMSLYDYATQSKNCDECESLEQCKNLMKGYYPKLSIQKQSIVIQYERCEKKMLEDEKRKSERLIKSMHVPKDILQASISSFDVGPGRIEAIERATHFIDNYEEGKRQKGLYLYGKFGVGKSYLLGAIANELAKKNVSSMIVYFPELLRELKGSIADSTLNEKIEVLKKHSVLMIDDIGAETMSSWSRDEVLGPILQYRMQEGLPTFFTSNFDYKELEHHLTYSQRGEVEEMKARRILERIKNLTVPVLIKGPNRRD